MAIFVFGVPSFLGRFFACMLAIPKFQFWLKKANMCLRFLQFGFYYGVGSATQRAKIPKSPVYADPDTSISDDPKKIPKIGGENMVKIRWVCRKDKDLDKVGWKDKIPKAKKPENGLEMSHPPNLVGID